MKTIEQILKEREAQISSRSFYIQKSTPVARACQIMKENDVGAMCVFDGPKFVGVFSERDVVRRVIAAGLDPSQVPVEQVMTTDLLVAVPAEDYRQSLEKMQKAKVRHLPVVAEGVLVGMLSIRDLFDEELRACVIERQTLTDYVYHVPPTETQ